MPKNKINVRGVPNTELDRLLQRLHINIYQGLIEEVEGDLLNLGRDKNFARQVLLTQYGSNKDTVLHAALKRGDEETINIIWEVCSTVLSRSKLNKLFKLKNAQGETVEELETIFNKQKDEIATVISDNELGKKCASSEENAETSISHPDNRVFLFDEEISPKRSIFSPASNAGFLSISSSAGESPYPFSPPAGGKSWVLRVEQERFTRGTDMGRAAYGQ